MHAVAIGLVAALMLLGPCELWAAQKDLAAGAEAKAWQEMARSIPLGSRVRVQTTAGRRFSATLMSVSDEAVIVKKNTRVPEPAIAVPFSEIARLERDEGRNGMSIGKVIGVGIATGASAILTMFLIASALDD